MQSLYTKGPENVPAGFTKPSPSFRKHVWLAILGLFFFAVLYIVLMTWFGRLAYHAWISGEGFWSVLLAGGYAFLCLFMLKSLFFLSKKEENPLRRYLTQEEEPVLFDYLYKLADEAGAPRPHKVFLTDRVNASVSYDLSILNLIIPSKKNLEIGLGLINVLNLGELKAVLAHEFGHFAQRSMLLGRYVYVAQQVAARIIGKRDIFDSFLNLISSIDIRISWIGWILSILVWAVRSLIETCFSVVAIAERALSREMEFQADLVAVSLTGSDALIHALSRLQVADEAYANATEMVNEALGDKKAVPNLYTLQSNYIEKMAWVLNEPDFGQSPKIREENPSAHRIFSERAYNPPQMWATHPADKDREENAKQHYVPASIDGRPAEDLLSHPEQYEEDMTAALIKTAKVETELISNEEAIARQNKEHFDWSFLDPKYNSGFLNRLAFTNFDSVDEAYSHEIIDANLASEFETLYKHAMAKKLEEFKEIKEEIEALEIARNEVVTVEKRIIWHRGDRIKRKDIPEILKGLEAEEEDIRSRLKKHDSRARSAHYAAALKLGNGWAPYLKDLSRLIHYAEHSVADITDCARKFHNVLAVALADGRVSSSELDGIFYVSNDYYKTVKAPFEHSGKMKLDPYLLNKFGHASYADGFEDFTLGWPDKENINRWVNVIDGWAGSARQSLLLLRNIALERLLDVEDQVRTHYLNGTSMTEQAPASISVVTNYNLLTPGKERSIQRKLKLWDRFMIGEGLFGSVAKFGVSALLVFGAIGLGSFTKSGELYLYNGLGIPVTVSIDEQNIQVDPNSYQRVDVTYGTNYSIVTTSEEGEVVDNISESLDNPKRNYVYNIAGAGAFVQYDVFYGYEGVSADKPFGAQRWIETNADYVLREPPSTISLPSGSRGTKKTALQGYSDLDPYDLISVMDSEQDIQDLVAAHVEWDAPKSTQLINWLNIGSQVISSPEALKNRIKHYGEDVATLRAMMIQADSLDKTKFCQGMHQKSSDAPDNPNYYYLKTRCLEDESVKNSLFVQGSQKWPDNDWLAYAAGYVYAQDEEWEKAYKAFRVAAVNKGLMEIAAVDAERVKRMIDDPNVIANMGPSVEMVSDDSIYFEQLAAGKHKDSEYDGNTAYFYASKGRVDEAYEFIQEFPNSKSYVLRILAVCEGASPKLKDEVKQLTPEEGLNRNTIWYAIAFCEVENLDNSPYISALENMGMDASELKQFIQLVKQGNTGAAREIIRKQEVYIKGHFYAIGAIIMKGETPKSWKRLANKLLMVSERPYLGVMD
ncbi:MAG: M48 family metallopeptidase [Bacteroidota bacterium]